MVCFVIISCLSHCDSKRIRIELWGKIFFEKKFWLATHKITFHSSATAFIYETGPDDIEQVLSFGNHGRSGWEGMTPIWFIDEDYHDDEIYSCDSVYMEKNDEFKKSGYGDHVCVSDSFAVVASALGHLDVLKSICYSAYKTPFNIVRHLGGIIAQDQLHAFASDESWYVHVKDDTEHKTVSSGREGRNHRGWNHVIKRYTNIKPSKITKIGDIQVVFRAYNDVTDYEYKIPTKPYCRSMIKPNGRVKNLYKYFAKCDHMATEPMDLTGISDDLSFDESESMSEPEPGDLGDDSIEEILVDNRVD